MEEYSVHVNDRLKTRVFDRIERGRSRFFQASLERGSLSRRKCRKSQPIGPVQGRRRRHAKRACPGRDRRAATLGVSSTCRMWTDLANRDRIAALLGDRLHTGVAPGFAGGGGLFMPPAGPPAFPGPTFQPCACWWVSMAGALGGAPWLGRTSDAIPRRAQHKMLPAKDSGGPGQKRPILVRKRQQVEKIRSTQG
jgi:hypothetical protein